VTMDSFFSGVQLHFTIDLGISKRDISNLILVPILTRTAPLAWLLIIGLRRFTIITPGNDITEKTARKLQLL
ncbi:hypothetical protein NE695_13295, partial [Neglectibacter timonensis]